jgi:diacylglycerol O-acyltransferase / wax synthase
MTDTLVDEPMSDVDAVIWAIEREPRLRTTIAALARFERRLDPRMLRHRVERVSRIIPRLRQRVVADAFGVVAPRWSPDPDFRLSFHLRRLQLSSDTEEQLLRVVRDLIIQPFDRDRPLWELTVIEGLADGGSAVLLKAHHSVSDGVGGVTMMLELFDLSPEPDADRGQLPDPPIRLPEADPAPTAGTLTRAVRDETARMLRSAARSLETLVSPGGPEDVVAGARRLGESLGSAMRMFRPGPAAALPAARSAGLELRAISLPLDDLRKAGSRIDGTINDAFVAAVAIAAAEHHRDGASTAPLRISVPVNTRTDDDEAGNHWTPGRIDLDIGTAATTDDVAEQVRRRMRGMRDEPAHDLLLPLASVLNRLPSAATAGLFSSLTAGMDLAASNVPGSPVPLHLCGEKVIALVPFGPLSGCALNVTLLSHAGVAHVGVATDPAAIPDTDGFLRDLESAFTAVVAGS